VLSLISSVLCMFHFAAKVEEIVRMSPVLLRLDKMRMSLLAFQEIGYRGIFFGKSKGGKCAPNTARESGKLEESRFIQLVGKTMK
jgi:hypothetical protein